MTGRIVHPKRRHLACALALFLLVGAGSGCGTLMASMVGLAADRSSRELRAVAPGNAQVLDRSGWVRLRYRDGTARMGYYGGLQLMEEARYESLYASRLPEVLPGLGDSVCLHLRFGQEARGRFGGVDPGVVLVSEAGVVRAHDLRVVEALESVGVSSLSGDTLRALARGPAWIPRSELVSWPSAVAPAFRDPGHRSPLADLAGIDMVRHPQPAQAMVLGGLVADIGCWILVRAWLSGSLWIGS